MSINRIKVEAHSQSINKVVTRFEGEFGVSVEGLTPTDRLEDLIAQLRQKNPDNTDDIDALIYEAFAIGAHAGFNRALARVVDGKITVRKVRNSDEWALSSCSKKYQITAALPAASGGTAKETVEIFLSDIGFE